MKTLAGPPPTKKRKLSKPENSVSDKKELKCSSCKFRNDRKKVLEAAKGGLQDVNVAFYGPSEVPLLDKKDRKIVKVWSDLKQGTSGMLQTCHSYANKVKKDMPKAPLVSHHVHFKRKPKHSSYQCSSWLKTENLRDLLPSSKFHSVRKRTPFSCKIEHIRTDTSLYLPNGHDSESKVGAAANRTYLAVPLSTGGVQSGPFPLVTQNLERAATESELPVCGVEIKHSDEGTHNLDFKGSILDGGLKVRRKITKAYVRNKYRKPFFKNEKSNLYALHLLAETALELGSVSICHFQLQKQEGESGEGHNEDEPLSTNNNKSHASKVNAERNGGEGPTLQAASVIQKDLVSDDFSLNVHALPEVNQLICTSIDEKQNSIQDLKKKDKELIAKDNHNINSHIAGFHVTKESQEVTNADRNTDGAENECIDCHSLMCTQPPTLEGFKTKESDGNINWKEGNQLKNKGSFLHEHGERIDEMIEEKDYLNLKRDSECYREQDSVFVSVESVCHDKVSSAWSELEQCSTYHENSQPRLLTCMPQNSNGNPSSSSTKSFFDTSLDDSLVSKGYPSSFNTTKFRNQNPGYRVREIVQSSKLKATGMVDVAVKAMSSMKAGEDAYAMIGEALDSGGILQVGVHSRISTSPDSPRSYRQNGGPGSCHQDICNPAEVVASIVHSINSTVPTFSQNDLQIPPKLISACVAALLMIQACSNRVLPPAEAMEILEHAARDLHPQYSQNLHIYREIEELMRIIKTQVLSLKSWEVSEDFLNSTLQIKDPFGAPFGHRPCF